MLIYFKEEVENLGDSILDKIYVKVCSLILLDNYE